MIEVQAVSRQFGSFTAVDNITLSVKKGEILGLLGPNGAGKTTTMRMITGFLEPTNGNILIDGINIQACPKEAKHKIGYMPESAPLYADMITVDYLFYVAKVQGLDAQSRVDELAEMCGLIEVMHKNIGELSRGYRQRVGLAHALMQDPEILILDEPTSGLDPNQIIEVRNLIKEIGKTRTVIISTHILGEVEMLCDRVVIISQGKIVADSPTQELKMHFGQRCSLRILVSGCSSNDLISSLQKIDKVASVKALNEESLVGAQISVVGGEDIRGIVSKTISDQGWIIWEFTQEQNSLEDIFRTLTSGGEVQ